MHQKLTPTQSQLTQTSNNSLISTLVTSILMMIFIMLAVTSMSLHTYQYQQEVTEKNLKNQAIILAKTISAADVSLLNDEQNDFVIFSMSAPLPEEVEKIITQKGSALLSKEVVKQLGLQSYSFEDTILITPIPFHHSQSLFIATPTPKRNLIRSFIYTGLYLSIAILVIMLTYSALFHNRVKRRLRYISEATHDIVKGNLNKRIPINPAIHDEYSEVSKILNTMLDKNAQLMQDLRQVNSNIAHDLKSPLNRMRSRTEIALLNSRTEAEYQQALSNSINDIDYLLKTFQSLLLMGNLDSDNRNYQLKPISLSGMLENLAELYEAVAEEKMHHFMTDITPDVTITANNNLLAQAISNLLENAINYTPNGGTIALSLKHSKTSALVIISDNGPGIPKEQHEEVFKRFSRLDSARQLPGTGLGMSLVKSILQIHKANIQLYDNQPGLRIEIRIKITQHLIE